MQGYDLSILTPILSPLEPTSPLTEPVFKLENLSIFCQRYLSSFLPNWYEDCFWNQLGRYSGKCTMATCKKQLSPGMVAKSPGRQRLETRGGIILEPY